MSPSYLQAKQTSNKENLSKSYPPHTHTHTKENNKTKPVLITLAFPLSNFNETRANPKTVIGYFPSSILFPPAITKATRCSSM